MGLKSNNLVITFFGVEVRAMLATLRNIGNSRGITIPKALLTQLELESEVEMSIEDGAIVLRKPNSNPRQRWAEAAQLLAEAGEDVLEWPEVGNAADEELVW